MSKHTSHVKTLLAGASVLVASSSVAVPVIVASMDQTQSAVSKEARRFQSFNPASTDLRRFQSFNPGT